MLTACGASTPNANPPAAQNPGTAISPTPTIVFAKLPSSTPLPTPTASSTPIVSTTVPATELPSVTPTNNIPLAADPTIRIAFATGTTSGSVQGTLSSQAVQSYILRAMWNQVMSASVTSSNNSVYLEIHGVWDGIYLTRFSNVRTSWQGWLPRTEEFIVQVYNSGSAATSYTLSVDIPARIRFATGAYSATIYGRGYAAKIISYVLYARGGQTMTATLSSATNSVFVSIHGFSGGQSLVDSSAEETSWTGTLPSTQEYILEAVQNSTWVSYTLTVTII
jgi:hypothetical protein